MSLLKEKLAGSFPPAFLASLLVVSLAWLVGGCAGSQARFENLRDSASLRQDVVSAQGFRLLLLERVPLAEQGGHVHVYIEGDGRPWIAGGEVVAADPTPRKPLALELLVQDKEAALYLGRPCYFVGVGDAVCSPQWWTNQRYSERVVQAMADALADWLARRPAVTSISLIGYSGGGVLAMLLGERVPQVRRVVAVASPLDHERWTALHGYSPLAGSLNVASLRHWRPDVVRLAVFGAEDRNVPHLAMQHALPPGAEVLVLPGMAHECCGDHAWANVLGRLRKAPAGTP